MTNPRRDCCDPCEHIEECPCYRMEVIYDDDLSDCECDDDRFEEDNEKN